MDEIFVGNHKNTRKSFINEVLRILTTNDPEIIVEFKTAFDFINLDNLIYHKEVNISGIDLFEMLIDYRATYFVPPNGPFSSTLELTCSYGGIKFLSVTKIQIEPCGFRRQGKRIQRLCLIQYLLCLLDWEKL